MPDTILLIDDDVSLCRVMEFTLQQAGYRVVVAFSGGVGLELFRRHCPSLIITDIQLPELTGFQLLEEVQKIDKSALFVFITGYSSIPNAVEAIKSGAYDYLTKPFSNDQLCLTVKKALEYRELQKENQHLKQSLQQQNTALKIIGQSQVMLSLLKQVEKVAKCQASVLICGESGTGKEIIARMTHIKSTRANQPFVAINCAAIPRDLLEAELFGHVKGSFTSAVKDRKGKFSLAHNGTLFLDEIGELPIDLQPKILRALQEHEIEPVGGTPEKVDVRIIAATNRNIEESMAEGRFRQDLYYRLAVIPIQLPPLRDRKEDIPLLVDFFLQKMKTSITISFTVEAMNYLQNYDWPGNVRELENVVEQSLILRGSDHIRVEDLPAHITNRGMVDNSIFRLPADGYSLDELEKEAIVQALQMCNWNKTKTAQLLRISRHVLNYRIDKFDLHP